MVLRERRRYLLWVVFSFVLNGSIDGPSPEAVGASIDAVEASIGAGVASELGPRAAALSAVDLSTLRSDAQRIAFWLNVYNALVRHLLLARHPTGTLISNLFLFNRASYVVGGHRFSLNDIEHGVLRRNARALPFFTRPFSAMDPRAACQVERVDPRVHFALNCGAVSCPPVRRWSPETLHESLDAATASYLRAMTRVDPERREVVLSQLLRLYAKDFGSRADAVRFTARFLEAPHGPWLAEHADAVTVRFGPYDWSLVRVG